MTLTEEQMAEFTRKLNETYTGAKLQKVMIRTSPTTVMCPCCFQPTPTEKAVKSADEHFGGALECETCKRTLTINKTVLESAFETQWPQCCGKQMTWRTRHDINSEVP